MAKNENNNNNEHNNNNHHNDDDDDNNNLLQKNGQTALLYDESGNKTKSTLKLQALSGAVREINVHYQNYSGSADRQAIMESLRQKLSKLESPLSKNADKTDLDKSITHYIEQIELHINEAIISQNTLSLEKKKLHQRILPSSTAAGPINPGQCKSLTTLQLIVQVLSRVRESQRLAPSEIFPPYIDHSKENTFFHPQLSQTLFDINNYMTAYYGVRGSNPTVNQGFFNKIKISVNNFFKDHELTRERTNILTALQKQIEQLPKPVDNDGIESYLREIEKYLFKAIGDQNKMSMAYGKSWQVLQLNAVIEPLPSIHPDADRQHSEAIKALHQSAHSIFNLRTKLKLGPSSVFLPKSDTLALDLERTGQVSVIRMGCKTLHLKSMAHLLSYGVQCKRRAANGEWMYAKDLAYGKEPCQFTLTLTSNSNSNSNSNSMHENEMRARAMIPLLDGIGAYLCVIVEVLENVDSYLIIDNAIKELESALLTLAEKLKIAKVDSEIPADFIDKTSTLLDELKNTMKQLKTSIYPDTGKQAILENILPMVHNDNGAAQSELDGQRRMSV